MWKVYELDAAMPVAMEILEEIHTITLHCLVCGMEAIYPAGSLTADKLIADAQGHRASCPMR